ncbi:Uma2 family endonuclease [Butyrivibrio sp. AE3004]|uniref:Uma2 family endonuclease n=1 Tax=Butyrivibrio sp. AE3004 TaxID=1506994 RepID=UPI000494404F|nr:Uma2 family endonuclease [Butyrivibrio sp. AE3004]
MTIDEMKNIKESRGYSFAVLSEYTGVPAITLQRIFSGDTKKPRKATLDAIEKVLTGDESVYSGKAYSYERNSVSYGLYEPERRSELNEKTFSYGAEGRTDSKTSQRDKYTLRDYYNLPKSQCMELIDGVFYEVDMPGVIHQIIISRFLKRMACYLDGMKSGIAMCFPANVRLDNDDMTMVKPDLFIVLDENKITDDFVNGAPDFVLEVISPASRKKDMFIKSVKYCEAGVKKYWMIDPKKRTLISYDYMDEDIAPSIVPLSGEKSMDLYDEELKINLDEIAEVIDRFK